MKTTYESNYEALVKSITPGELKELVYKIKRISAANGIIFRDKTNPKYYYHIPLTLFPSPFPKKSYDFLKSIQPDINCLIRSISQDYNFLEKSLQNVIHDDHFTSNLLDILKLVKNYKFPQKIFVGIIRSDYMVDDNRVSSEEGLKAYLVEYNTVSVSFGAQGSQVQAVHESVLQHLWGIRNEVQLKIQSGSDEGKVVENICVCLATAWVNYVEIYKAFHTCILFVVQENERNIFDYVKLEKALLKILKSHPNKNARRSIIVPPVFYVRLADLANSIKVNEIDGQLLYQPNPTEEKWCEVALVYFRSCYTPTDFENDICWKTRQILELNRSIKIPTIAQQLTGCKKIQQLINSPSVLRKYLSETIAKQVLKTFVGTYSLDEDDPNFENILEKVKKNPTNYVMKPQREGGGNNLYGEKILTTIEEHLSNKKSLSQYILMDIIHPTVFHNYLVIPDSNDAIPTECVSELGIWGCYVCDDNQFLLNLSSGYIFRSKSVKELDGGVASGRAVLDSICFF